tara:strand:+ start:7386 stop:8066 length:681 start_codon:yes stop_codon:yes gene_type:complete
MPKKNLNYLKNISDKKIWDSENVYHLRTNISRISKLIYQYEIFKKIKNIPGDIFEFGVFKGISLVRLLTYRSILENSFSRKIYGFDTFKSFPKENSKVDRKLVKKWESTAGYSISKEELNFYLKMKNFENFELIQGDLRKTLPKFLNRQRNVKIALLHIDLEVYSATKFVIHKLLNHMSSKGIILLDDYPTVKGATKVIDELLKKNKNLKIKKMSFYQQPSFIIMP